MKKTFYTAFGAIAIISGSILSSCNTNRQTEETETAESVDNTIMNTDTTNSMNMDNNNMDTDSIRAVE